MHPQSRRERTKQRATATTFRAFCALCAIFRKCARVAATPVAGSGSTARARRSTATQQLTSSGKSSGVTMLSYRFALGLSLIAYAVSPAVAQQTIVIPDNLFTQAG